MNKVTRMSERWIRRKEVGEMLGYSESTIARLEKQLALKNVAPKGCHPRYKLSSVMELKARGVGK